MIGIIIYAIGFVATYFWLKRRPYFNKGTWFSLIDRLVLSSVFPLTLVVFFFDSTKPPKWL